MTAGDKRGFRYPLEAIALRQQWAIDRLEGRIRAEQANLDAIERKQAELRTGAQTQATRAQDAWTQAPDPATRRPMLGYLAQLQADQARLRLAAESIRAQLKELQAAVVEQRIRLGALEEHRGTVREAFLMGQQRSADARADAQWLALSVWRAGAER